MPHGDSAAGFGANERLTDGPMDRWTEDIRLDDLTDQEFRDDAPPTFRLGRRKVVIGGVVMLGGLVVGTRAWSGAPVGDAGPFMDISRLLIAHRLDATVGARIAAALAKITPDLSAHVDALLKIARAKDARIVEDFFDDIPQGPLKATALAIISAWYLGVVGNEPGAEVFAYELALMYQPTRDVMTIPTYAISGPNGWGSAAPPLTDMPDF
jgi:hypothetical protein